MSDESHCLVFIQQQLLSKQIALDEYFAIKYFVRHKVSVDGIVYFHSMMSLDGRVVHLNTRPTT